MVSFRFRKTIRKIHLCLGLLTGTIVFLVALSGALYCFAPELELLTQPYRFTGDAGGAAGHAGGAAGDAVGQPLAPDRLLGIAATEVPGRQPGRIYYHGAGRSVEIVYYKDKKADKALFLHPRSGVLLQVKDLRTDPVQQLFYFHRTLFLPYGEKITGTATLVFLVMVITGIILWWPRNAAAKKQRFKIKWGASPKRLQYDLHSVIGFYVSWIAILFIVTGLNFSFPWFAKIVYRVTGSAASVVAEKAPLSTVVSPAGITDGSLGGALQQVWQVMQAERDNYQRSILVLPADSSAAILWRANPDRKQLYRSDFRYFNRYDGKEISGDHVWGRYTSARTGSDHIRRMNYDIHTGAIAGLPGRIIAFLASLLIASLPVTGFLLWRKASP